MSIDSLHNNAEFYYFEIMMKIDSTQQNAWKAYTTFTTWDFRQLIWERQEFHVVTLHDTRHDSDKNKLNVIRIFK